MSFAPTLALTAPSCCPYGRTPFSREEVGERFPVLRLAPSTYLGNPRVTRVVRRTKSTCGSVARAALQFGLALALSAWSVAWGQPPDVNQQEATESSSAATVKPSPVTILAAQVTDNELDTLAANAILENATTTPTGPAAYDDLRTHDGWWHGDIHVIPYGIGWWNAAYDSLRTSPGPFTLFSNSPEVEGEDAFHVNVRATRLGMDFTGPDIQAWQMGGKVEIDFYGAALTENRAGLLLRHAYGELRQDGWRLLAGQTNDVISPLAPNTVNYATGLAAGNIGFRSPQLRVEHQTHPAAQWRLTTQASLNRTIIADFVDNAAREGHDAGWPTLMSRVAIAWLPPDDPQRAWELGVSGHVGQVAVDFEAAPVELDRKYPSWSLNADLSLPFTRRFGAQGEFFLGETLSTFLGGINQSVDPVLRDSIGSLGGWGELWWKFHDTWTLHAGYGIDDPWNDRLSIGRRCRNQMFYANVMWDISTHLRTGLEVSHWTTAFIGLAPGSAWRFEVAVKYAF